MPGTDGHQRASIEQVDVGHHRGVSSGLGLGRLIWADPVRPSLCRSCEGFGILFEMPSGGIQERLNEVESVGLGKGLRIIFSQGMLPRGW